MSALYPSHFRIQRLNEAALADSHRRCYQEGATPYSSPPNASCFRLIGLTLQRLLKPTWLFFGPRDFSPEEALSSAVTLTLVV